MDHVSLEVAQAITRKKLRYARYADTKQWDLFEKEVSVPDTQYDYQDVNGKSLVWSGCTLRFSSTKDFRGYFEPVFASLQTLHIVAPGDFTRVGAGEAGEEDEVRAVFAFEDQLLMPPFGSWAELRGGGFYYETWKLIDGDWRLKELRMRRNYQKSTFLMKVATALARFRIKS